MIVGLDPILGQHPKVVILGSMPSVTSLKKQEYYGFSQNRFWKFMQQIFAMPIHTYEEKTQIILRHHIALWDVIHSCERQGSLDSAIHHEQVNDITALLKQNPSIAQILCNGRKSYHLYQRHFSSVPLPCIYLPSTSNANRSIKEAALYAKWEAALSIYRNDARQP